MSGDCLGSREPQGKAWETYLLDAREAKAAIGSAIDEWARGRNLIRVLEAGGGSLSHISFPVATKITVVDISPEQLERNTLAETKILGDLHTVEIDDRFDAIVCYDVLEHLDRPGQVARKLAGWLDAGGLLLIAAPNRQSLQGMITRLTPHWFHVFAYRTIFGSKTAGKPGYAPFRTVHHRDIGPDRLASILAEAGLKIAALERYASDQAVTLRAHHPLLGSLYYAVLRAATVFNRDAANSDFFLAGVKRQ